MESYLEDDRRFHSPESKKSRLHGSEGLYLHSTPLSQLNPHQLHPLSLSFTGLKDLSNTEKITPLYSPLTDEGYSSVGSSSTPTGMLNNNMPTFELFNHHYNNKDYSHPACMHNPSNQREKLEIVALELLNQARLIPHPACFGRPVTRDVLGNCEENLRSQGNTNNFQFLGGFHDKCQLLPQTDMRFGNFNHPSLDNGNNEFANLSQYNSFCPRPVPSMTTNISQNLYRQHLSEQLKHHRQFENSTRVDNDTTTNNNSDNSGQSPEHRSRMCNQILSQVRREMIKLIDNSMQQLETYLQNNHFEGTYTSSNFLDYCNSLKSVQANLPEDLNVTPLNLKFSKSNMNAESVSDVNSMPGQDLHNTEDFNLNNRVSSELKPSNSLRRTTTPTKDSPMTNSSRTRQLRLANKTRRLRIHQFNSQLFLDKNEAKKSASLSAIDNKRQIHSDEKEPPSKIPHLDESLDLRIHHEAVDDDDKSQSEEAISSHNLQNNYSHTRLKRSILSNHTRTTTLSAIHLKKAKMMFMYSRYPTSSLLKSYFPEVIFNRGSTAQLVKWFSNFREFFYIQIEKFVRQQKAAGLKQADDIRLSREHELIRSMEMHFNKGDEIETPKEFLDAIQITVWEFADAVLNGRDANPSWKKSIYKKISTLDVQFPEFFKC